MKTTLNKSNQTNVKKVAEGLSKVLADSYSLYLMTQNFHWNVKGPQFVSLHTLFETQYTELALAVDAIAERIRALGEYAPGSYEEFQKLSSIKQVTGKVGADEMVRVLYSAHQQIAKTLKNVLPHAQVLEDEVSADLVIGRMAIHEKTAWMLKSLTE